jgi:hypothetical protein
MAKETFTAARARLHRELAAHGWILSKPTLKELWAEKPYIEGRQRLSFKAQAVYLGAHTLDLDIRGMSIDTLIEHAERSMRIRRQGLFPTY